MKDSKRVVELKFQTLLGEKERWVETMESLSQEAELLQVKNQSLEERLASLQQERDDQTEILAEIQQSLVQRTSSHEAEVRRMQEELDRRLDEIIATTLEDVENVKEHYFRLFNEKAAELMLVRSELDLREVELAHCRTRCRDLEYREQELNDLVNRMRENPEQIFGHEVKKKLEDYETSTRQLADRLQTIQAAFTSLKSKEAERIEMFARECSELRAQLLLREAQLSKSHKREVELSPPSLSHKTEVESSSLSVSHKSEVESSPLSVSHKSEVESSPFSVSPTRRAESSPLTGAEEVVVAVTEVAGPSLGNSEPQHEATPSASSRSRRRKKRKSKL